jgi:Spy/CpxP family protein refolding chaperone
MNQIRFFKIVILILVILNLGTLAFLWFARPGSGRQQRQNRPADFLARELRLTPAQRNEFGRLRHEHLYRLSLLQKQERDLHERFFGEVLLPEPDSLRMKILIDSMTTIRSRMEMLTFNHFRQLTKLLTTEQKERFDRVFWKILDRVMPRLPAPPEPPEPQPPPSVPPGKRGE